MAPNSWAGMHPPLCLLKLLSLVLMLLPSYLGPTLHLRARRSAAPGSLNFVFVITYGLFTIALLLAGCKSAIQPSPPLPPHRSPRRLPRHPHQLSFVSVLYMYPLWSPHCRSPLTVRLPDECPFANPHPIKALFWVGFVILGVGVTFWNSWLHMAGQADRLIPSIISPASLPGYSTSHAVYRVHFPTVSIAKSLARRGRDGRTRSSIRMKPADEAVLLVLFKFAPTFLLLALLLTFLFAFLHQVGA
ncbi:hypothetical protein DFH09DRAFT_1331972 [Mycena vulgaris]|nr:hypothetical protein DFH09DRAFT_1331972 [Mycena vulgaris]